MSEYIQKIQRKLISEYGFPERSDAPGVPCDGVPDGEYPMTIDGKLDRVRVVAGCLLCCNFAERPAAEETR